MPQNTLDPQVVALAKAVRQTESQTNPTARGKSGEYGAYQYTAPTWAAQAKAAGVNVPLEQSNLEQQNEVFYKWAKAKKDAGYNVGQIASMHNAGEGAPDAYLGGHKGVNQYGAAYDVPEYAKKVATLYQQYKNETLPGVQPNVGAPGSNTLIQDLSKNVGDVATGVSQAWDGSQDQNLFSRVLQTGGAVAGGLGDVTNTLLEHTPVVGSLYKGIEGGIGGAIQGVANTDIGQQAIQGYQGFAEAHPEAARNVGSAVNIASAIPLLKGLTLAKTAVTDVAKGAFRGSYEKSAAEAIKGSLTKRPAAKLERAEARGVSPVQTMVENKQYLPDSKITDGKLTYDTKNATKAVEKDLNVDETGLKKVLDSVTRNKGIGVDLNAVRQQVIKDVTKEYSLSGNYRPAINAINDYFDSFQESVPKGRTIIDLNELNSLKRDVRGAVNFDNLGASQRSEIRYYIGQSVMKQIENTAKKSGIPGLEDAVKNLNKAMGGKLEILKILDAMEGKTASPLGRFGREVAQDVAGAAGEGLGNMLGIPFSGTLAARGLGGLVSRRLPKTAVSRLKERRPLRSTLKTAGLNLSGGLGLQSTSQSQ